MALPTTANAAVVKFKATLNGAQEVPATDSKATGTADLDFDDAANTLSGEVDLTLPEGTNVTGDHIHEAVCGESGSIVKGLTPPGINGVIFIDPPLNLDADAVKALNEGKLYVNIHTDTFMNGEIRGQIYKADSTDACPASAGGGDGGTSSGGVAGDGGASSGGTADGGSAPASSSKSGCNTTGNAALPNGILFLVGMGVVASALRRRTR